MDARREGSKPASGRPLGPWEWLRVSACWGELVFAPLFALWFGHRFPDPEEWAIDSFDTVVLYISAFLWGLAALHVFMPWSLHGTVAHVSSRVSGTTATGRRTIPVGSGTVIRRWKVPNPKAGVETWWSVRRGRSWLLVPDDRMLTAEQWAGGATDFQRGSAGAAMARGWGAMLAFILLTLAGLLLALLLVDAGAGLSR